jgi:hypothetical protein
MSAEWEQHCPISEDEWPVQRQAWHGGWMYRMEHGPGFSDGEAEAIKRRSIDENSPSMLSIWLQGYSAADNYQRDELDD